MFTVHHINFNIIEIISLFKWQFIRNRTRDMIFLILVSDNQLHVANKCCQSIEIANAS